MPTGIANKRDLGQATELKPGSLVPYVVQEHNAIRAGLHNDVRMGTRRMLSWATRKELPEPGKKIQLFQQPVHDEWYKTFQGNLYGYGAGTVKTKDLGEVLVLETDPGKIKIVTAHTGVPQEFTLVRINEGKKPSWLMINSTPRETFPDAKPKYIRIPQDEIDKLITGNFAFSEKIDGASVLVNVLKDKIQLLSHRVSKTGQPIVHTQRAGLGAAKVDVPKELQGQVFRGELYGVRDDKAIPPQEISGLLNSSVGKALKDQHERKIKMRLALFGLLHDEPMSLYERRQKIQKLLTALPKDFAHEPQYAYSAEEKRKMWKDIKSGKNPLTHEGVVAVPLSGGVSHKVKTEEERDVYIRDIFEGQGRARGSAGGFSFSLTEGGPVVGKVGSGFDDDIRRQLWDNKADFGGRVARVRDQGQYGSGALRAPVFLGLHEDYPMKSAFDLGFAVGLEKRASEKDVQLFQKQLAKLNVDPSSLDDVDLIEALLDVENGSNRFPSSLYADNMFSDVGPAGINTDKLVAALRNVGNAKVKSRPVQKGKKVNTQ